MSSVAPGAPGGDPRWISSRKSGVGTAFSGESPVWFALGEGIVNEVYYPRIDCANTRNVTFLLTGPDGFFADERTDTTHAIEPVEPGIPAYRLVNTARDGRFRLAKRVFTDPRRPVLLLDVAFEPQDGRLADYRLFVVVAPHLANQGAHNDGWLGEFRSTPLLLARRAHVTLALGCSAGWAHRSCGYVGTSDGWHQVRGGGLVPEYPSAPDGNITLTGEIDLAACGGHFVLALGFGRETQAAGHAVRAALLSPLDDTLREYVGAWRRFHASCLPLTDSPDPFGGLYRTSTAVLRTHESKRFHGGVIASLAIPWGGHHGDQDIGGYHLVWPRDLYHAAAALLAAGRPQDAQQCLFYLMCTEDPHGNWKQNMWVDGTADWTANQTDQTASFVLLVDLLRQHHETGLVDPYPTVARVLDYLLLRGPVTDQDRWEENRGYTPYTLATAIAALITGAQLADERGDHDLAVRCREAADQWNASIERWLYVTDTPLAHEVGVEGYYVRIGPPGTQESRDLRRLIVPLKNYDPPSAGRFAAWEITSPDALALVRYGLRAADDPRILNTVRVLDATLRCETRTGPAWKRFTHDGYGETAAGGPFLGAGIGRRWPVLTGERAHYELARGRREEAFRLARVMAAQACHGLLPEQIWDGEDRPELGLYNGGPTGSATPLVWAHAEFVTLLRSLRDGAVFDTPPAVAARYLNAKPPGGAGATG